jgi:hypothetical protein
MPGMPRVLVSLAFVVALGGGSVSVGQTVDVGGRIYVDYFYNVSAPDDVASPGAEEGMHGFQYRRLYLTSDFALSEDLTGRARLEADGATGGETFVKDLSLTWAYSGPHRATLGITPPPAFGLAEGVWGYRSLDKTIMDLQGVVGSRDFGLRLDGPIAGDGTVRYAVMLANNSGLRNETNTFKRVYGQVAVRPSERLLFVVGADRARYNGERDSGTRVSVFGGYTTDRFRVGAEGYWFRAVMADENDLRDVGGSLFGSVQVRPDWSLVARVDRSAEFRAGPDRFETFLIGGVSYRPHSNVTFIPNLRMQDPTDEAATVTGRFTVEVNF